MENYPAGEVEKNGITVPLTVDNYGAWKASVAGQHLVADTRDKLVTKITQITKSVVKEVEIPFTILNTGGPAVGPSVRPGVATGFHAGNGNILATMDTPRGYTREQLNRSNPYSKPLDEAEKAEFLRLALLSRAARQALNTFVRERGIDLRKTLTDALEKAAQD
jgi:hypothetical protein